MSYEIGPEVHNADLRFARFANDDPIFDKQECIIWVYGDIRVSFAVPHACIGPLGLFAEHISRDGGRRADYKIGRGFYMLM